MRPHGQASVRGQERGCGPWVPLSLASVYDSRCWLTKPCSGAPHMIMTSEILFCLCLGTLCTLGASGLLM